MRGDQDQSLGASRKSDGRASDQNPSSTSDLGARRHIMVTLDPRKGDEYMVQFPMYPFYVLILPGIAAIELRAYLRENWLTLDALTGEYALLLTPVIPTHVTSEYLDWWSDRLPSDLFNELKAKLERGLDPGAEDRAGSDVYEMARQQGIDRAQLPIMIITATQNSQSEPDLLIGLDARLNRVMLGRFFQEFADACQKCSSESNEVRRLEALKRQMDHILPKYRPDIPTVRIVEPLRVQVFRGLWQLLGGVVPSILRAILMVP